MTYCSYVSVTELSGEDISEEQLHRSYTRYKWAQHYCKHKNVVEIACGAGQGLGLIKSVAKDVLAGDIESHILSIAQKTYGDRIRFKSFSAESLPLEDESVDVLILFEAIYYLQNVEKFIQEAYRVLTKGGHILICMPNKDLYDFNPSPYSSHYYNLPELSSLLRDYNFETEGCVSHPVGALNFRQRLLRPIKKLIVSLNLMPKSMKGKKLLKKLVFGKMTKMPAEMPDDLFEDIDIVKASMNDVDKNHKVLYCCATKN
jgi:ubiquinone/menaquinone biosynthesis C-methylase UbiE